MAGEGDEGLTIEEYRAQVKALGLSPDGQNTGKTTIHISRERDIVPVPNPDWQTPRQRKETIEKLKRRMGVGIFHDSTLQ